MPINVFASYRSSSAAFVEEFLELYVGVHRTELLVFDWTGPDRIQAGEQLDSQLTGRIEKADIFLAFIDGDYGEGITHAELRHAIATAQRRKRDWPRIVPLPLDVGGEAYLAPLAAEGGPLHGITYEPCYDRRGKRYPSEDRRFGDWIAGLGEQHREARGAPAATAPAVIVAPTEVAGVVLLDRAVADPPADGAERRNAETVAAEEVLARLRAVQVPAHHALPGWADGADAALGDFAAKLPALVYVQVLSAPAIRTSLTKVGQDVLRRRLGMLVDADRLARSRVAYWLPEDQPATPEFAEEVVRSFDGDPSFRNDGPDGMTEWLGGLLGLGLPKPVAAYQDVEGEASMQEMLRAKVDAMVGPGLPARLEDRELYPYSINGLEGTIISVAKRRPILITHNINANVPVNNPKAVRNATIQQLSEVTRCADRALQKQGVSPDEVFWLSILVEGNPLTTGDSYKFPIASDFRLHRWYVLQLRHNGNDYDFETGPRRDKVTEELVKWGAAG